MRSLFNANQPKYSIGTLFNSVRDSSHEDIGMLHKWNLKQLPLKYNMFATYYVNVRGKKYSYAYWLCRLLGNKQHKNTKRCYICTVLVKINICNIDSAVFNNII